jgi:hypothetical protein
LTPAFIKNILESDRQSKAIPEAFAEKFRKAVPSPSDSSIIHFMDSFTSILSDFGLAHMMTLTVDEVKSRKYHLVDRIISNLLIDKVRKTAAFRCIQDSDKSGMALYQEVVKTFFDEMKKVKLLLKKVLDELKELCLLRISDVHHFFSSAQWYYHFLKLLDPTYRKGKFDKFLGDCLNKSHTWLQNRKDGDVTFVGLLSRKGEIGADKLIDELFKLYTTIKLSGDGLPENLSQSYVSMKAYVKMLEDLTPLARRRRTRYLLHQIARRRMQRFALWKRSARLKLSPR